MGDWLGKKQMPPSPEMRVLEVQFLNRSHKPGDPPALQMTIVVGTSLDKTEVYASPAASFAVPHRVDSMPVVGGWTSLLFTAAQQKACGRGMQWTKFGRLKFHTAFISVDSHGWATFAKAECDGCMGLKDKKHKHTPSSLVLRIKFGPVTVTGGVSTGLGALMVGEGGRGGGGGGGGGAGGGGGGTATTSTATASTATATATANAGVNSSSGIKNELWFNI
jgi:hypothetical protein